MLSPKKRDAIARTLIRSAIDASDRTSPSFDFELRGEICKAAIRGTWDDGMEFSIRVEIGKHDLVTGFHYPKDDKITHTGPPVDATSQGSSRSAVAKLANRRRRTLNFG
jgi:hypothetical protein